MYRCEFWFLDWFDGYGRALTGKDLDLMTEIWEFFNEVGSVDAVLEAATE